MFKIFVFSIIVSLSSFGQNKKSSFNATIIGSGSPEYNTERASGSVLIQNERTKILIDMGNGTQANLNKLGVDIRSLNGLLITHHHLDHNEELAPIFIQMLLGKDKFSIFGPPNTNNFVTNYRNLYTEDINYRLSKSNRSLEDRKDSYDVKDLVGGESFTIDDIKISTLKVPHTIYTLSYKLEYEGKIIVVCGDLTYYKELADFAKNADVFIIESGGMVFDGKRNPYTTTKNKPQKNNEAAHLNLEESSQIAGEAKVKKLVYTHFRPGKVDEKSSTEVIRKNYSGEIIFGTDLLKIE